MDKCLKEHSKLHRVHEKCIDGTKIIDLVSPTALPALVITHASSKAPVDCHHALVGSYCTRHQLGRVILVITNNNAKIMGK